MEFLAFSIFAVGALVVAAVVEGIGSVSRKPAWDRPRLALSPTPAPTAVGPVPRARVAAVKDATREAVAA